MRNYRKSPIQIEKEDFTKIGHQLIDAIADFYDTIENRPVTKGESPSQLQNIIGVRSLPNEGSAAGEIISKATELLFEHSLFNGHPKFHGYITSSPAPIGSLADLLASTVNPNVGAN